MADAVKELVIRIRREVDPKGEAAAKAAHAAERKRIAEGVAAAKKAEKEKADAAKKAAKEAADAAKKAAKEAADAENAAAKSATAAEREKAREREAAAKKRIAETRRTVRESERLERELFAEGRRIARERATAETRDEAESAKRSKAAHDLKARLARESAAAQKAAVAAVGVLVSSVEQGWHRANELALEATDKVVGYRKALVELATLRPGGKTGATGPELRKNLAISQATGVGLEGVERLTTKAYAGASSFLGPENDPNARMTPEDFAKAVVTAGKFGAIMGGDAGDYGSAAALIPVLAGKRIDAGQFEGELERFDKMATTAGVANPSDLFKQMQQNVGYATSGVLSGAELGGLTAGFSQTAGSARAGERVQQAINAVSGATVKDRGGNIADEFVDQSATTAGYTKRLGITRDTGTLDRLKIIADDLNAQRAANPDFNASEYLITQGFGNEGSRSALMEFAGNAGRFGAKIEPLITQQFAPGGVDRRHAEAMRTDSAIRQNMVDANTQLVDVVEGEPLIAQNQARRLAYNQLRAEGKARGSFEDYVNPTPLNVLSPASWTDMISRKWHGVGTGALDSIANDALVDQARSMGLDAEARMFEFSQVQVPGRHLFTNETMQEKAAPFNDLAGAIQAAGGDPFAELRKAAELQLKAARAILDSQSAAPRPVAGAPPAGPGRQ